MKAAVALEIGAAIAAPALRDLDMGSNAAPRPCEVIAPAPAAPDPIRHSSPLRILMVALNYAPDLIGCAKYNTELAEDLVARGHQVEVVCAPPYYPKWQIGDGYSGAKWRTETRNGVKLHRTPLYVPATPSGGKRALHLASFAAGAFGPALAAARRFKPNLVFAVAPTLTAATVAVAAAKISGARSWLHIQDFEIDAAFELGLLRNTQLRTLALNGEQALLRTFDQVSTISPAMLERLYEKGVDKNRALEFRNWADIDGIRPLPSTNTSYRSELGIPEGNVVALYSGNMAAKQGLEMLAEVAARLETLNAPVTLVLCGEGPARANLAEACLGRSNVRFLPLQPLDRFQELLGTADIHLLPQKPEAADLVLPSKLAGMFASGRPIIAMAAPDTGLAYEVFGCGLVVEPNARAMTEAILTLSYDGDLRFLFGQQSRRRAEQSWRKSELIGRFEKQAALAAA